MLRCFFQRCMVDSRTIIDAFRTQNRGVETAPREISYGAKDAPTPPFCPFFSVDPCIIFFHNPGPGSDQCTCTRRNRSQQVPTGPSGSDSPASMLLTCPSPPLLPLDGLISGRLSFFLETARQECLCLEHDFQPDSPSGFFFQVCGNFYDLTN